MPGQPLPQPPLSHKNLSPSLQSSKEGAERRRNDCPATTALTGLYTQPHLLCSRIQNCSTYIEVRTVVCVQLIPNIMTSVIFNNSSHVCRCKKLLGWFFDFDLRIALQCLDGQRHLAAHSNGHGERMLLKGGDIRKGGNTAKRKGHCQEGYTPKGRGYCQGEGILPRGGDTFKGRGYSISPYKLWGSVAELTCHLQVSTPNGMNSLTIPTGRRRPSMSLRKIFPF
jgi:hypothetical protein